MTDSDDIRMRADYGHRWLEVSRAEIEEHRPSVPSIFEAKQIEALAEIRRLNDQAMLAAIEAQRSMIADVDRRLAENKIKRDAFFAKLKLREGQEPQITKMETSRLLVEFDVINDAWQQLEDERIRIISTLYPITGKEPKL